MLIVVIIFLVFLNGFFSAVEIAFISLNDVKIGKEAKEGNKKAKKIKEMMIDPSKFLATIQIGITFAGFLSSAFAAETFSSKLAPVLYYLIPSININVWNSFSIIIVTLLLSYFTLIFGELVPKRLAMKNYEKIAYFSVEIIQVLSIISLPFVKLLSVSTNIISKIFGVNDKEEETVTEEEIRMLVDVGEEKGAINEYEGDMINNVFEFNDIIVSEVMTPRTNIYALNSNMTIEEVIKEMNEDFTYSRIPLYDEDIDNIEGFIHVKDLFLTSKEKDIKVKKIMKDVYYVPETKPINELFSELRKNSKQLAIVIDEYGGTAGLVTIEDILEEIVGEIYDEYDDIKDYAKKIDENTFEFSGEIALYEVEDIMDIEIEEGDYDTLSGYLVEILGRIPNEKDEGVVIETKKANYKIEKVINKHIVKVKVCKVN
ncbi:MAG: HlyC/CorC family transporter [Clostridia bacterium]|nr:HlyC/CorC family transporter [Clostridia bacterium]